MSTFDHFHQGYVDALSGHAMSRDRSYFSPAYLSGYERGKRERFATKIQLTLIALAFLTIALIVGFLGTGVI